MLVLLERFSDVGQDLCNEFHNVLRLLARLIDLRFEFVLGLGEQEIQLLVIRFKLAYPVSLRHRRL